MNSNTKGFSVKSCLKSLFCSVLLCDKLCGLFVTN
jgi:hypothetical protein